MARYIDADKFLKELEKQICDDCIDEVCGACGVGCARAIALELPTADVVPKSEADMLHHLLKDAWKRIEELDNLCGELQKAKDEVAREIFEEIEKTVFADMDFFKELKKKYTEGE